MVTRLPCSLPRYIGSLFALPFFLLLFGLDIAHAQTQSATLSWRGSRSSGATGYLLYCGTASGNYTQTVNVGLSTTGTLSNLAAGTTYYSVVTAYNSAGLQSLPSNEVSFTTPSPAVSLTNPANGVSLTAPAALVLSASASETGGSISYVKFYNGTTYLGEATTSPYTFTWNNVPAGTYSLTAVAFDPTGASTVSSAASITVGMAAPAANAMGQPADGSFTFTMTGGTNGVSQTYNVWVSSDLQTWTLLQTVTSSTGTFSVTDASAAGAQSRFYEVSPE